jgi:hypothetical protein
MKRSSISWRMAKEPMGRKEVRAEANLLPPMGMLLSAFCR